jgi:prepilin-type N-terminal cleavage/methylation domain-containing protein
MSAQVRTFQSEQGFTLIELLTVIGIIGVVSALGLTSFYVYKSDAAYAVSARLVQDGVQAVEASLSLPDQILPEVASYSQSSQGPISDPSAATVLSGIMVPRKMKLQFSFDPACLSGACVAASLQANHCQAVDFPRWVRYGDGVDIRLEHIVGSGCS